MNPSTHSSAEDDFFARLLSVVDRIAISGDLQAVQPLLEMTSAHSQSPLLTALAESFAHMVVKLEAREYELECTIEDLQRAKAELEKANYDPLTGLPNRVIARDRLHQALLQAKRNQGQLAVFYLDLDKFKWVNDHMGHAAGDELLQQVAQRCQLCVRAMDTVARLGGDEFLVVLPSIEGQEMVEELAQRFVDSLGKPFSLRDGEARIGASVGIALYPEHAGDVDQLIELADAALYMAKHAGRNVYKMYLEPPETSQKLCV
jgi:diguanylate cyclase (GGDEF)-like protein